MTDHSSHPAASGHPTATATEHPPATSYPRTHPTRRGRGDGGTVLMLMPAGVLIVLVLGALAVDLSVVHLAQREAATAAGAAVNDAVTWGVDDTTLYATGAYTLDPTRVTHAIEISLAAQEYSGRNPHLAGPPQLTDTNSDGNPDTITITVTMHTDYIFAGAIPGANPGTTVTATATATAHSN